MCYVCVLFHHIVVSIMRVSTERVANPIVPFDRVVWNNVLGEMQWRHACILLIVANMHEYALSPHIVVEHYLCVVRNIGNKDNHDCDHYTSNRTPLNATQLSRKHGFVWGRGGQRTSYGLSWNSNSCHNFQGAYCLYVKLITRLRWCEHTNTQRKTNHTWRQRKPTNTCNNDNHTMSAIEMPW